MAAGAFILAAGFGTRLRPLTLYRPKPLVPICGVPLLSYALALCERNGIREAIVNTHWLPKQFLQWEGVHEGVKVSIQVEPEILGTGGGLKKAADKLAERFVVLNGDVLHTVDLFALLEQVPEGGGALVLRPDAVDADRYGHVSADETGTVVQMRDFASTKAVGKVQNDTHFTGIHAIHRGLLDDAQSGFSDILRTAHKARIGRRLIRGVRYSGPWLDIGDPTAYLETNMSLLRGELHLALDPFERAGEVPPGVTVEGPVWVGPDARIAPGAHLSHAVIGANARIGSVRVENSVVWDGVSVRESLQRTIAHDGGAFRVDGR